MGLFKRQTKQPAGAADPALLEHERELERMRAEREDKRVADQRAEREAAQNAHAAKRQARRATLQAVSSRAIGAYRSRKQAKADAHLASDTFKVEIDALDAIEQAKLFFARAAMFLGAFLLMIVAAWSVGFFFAGMHDFTTDNQDVFLSYLGAFALEAIFTGLMFTATLNKKRGRPWMLLFTGLLVLALISMLAQFASYEAQLQQGRLTVSDSAIESIPLLTWLIGSMKGHSFLFLLRGGAFHFAEILACLGQPSKRRTVDEQIGEMQRIQKARLEYQEAKLFADWKAARAAAIDADMRASMPLSRSEVLHLPRVTAESEGHAGNGHSTF